MFDFRRVAVAVLALSSATNCVAEEDRVVWEQGGWQVAVMTSTRGFVGCYAMKDYIGSTSRVRFVFANYADDDRWSGLIGGSATSVVANVPVSLYVDGTLVHSAIPTVTQANAARLGRMTSQAIDALATGQILEVATASNRGRFALAGSADALGKVVNCVATVGGTANSSAASVAQERTLLRVNDTVPGGFLNLRQRPSRLSALLGSIPAGQRGVELVGRCQQSDDGSGQAQWCNVRWSGSTGWASATGLSADGDVPVNQTAALANAPPASTPTTPPSATSTPKLQTGTAFFVSSAGHLLTNAHVASGCTDISVGRPGVTAQIPAIVLAVDKSNDLALLKVDEALSPTFVPSLRRQLRIGERVAVFGYPLTNTVASSGNFTLGSVSALEGLRDDSTQFQLSAPVQPGNSGGPVMDQSGNVVGVVVAKLDAIKMAAAIGSIPEQINFAIKATAAISFLEAKGISTKETTSVTAMTDPDIADQAKKFTVLVKCLTMN